MCKSKQNSKSNNVQAQIQKQLQHHSMELNAREMQERVQNDKEKRKDAKEKQWQWRLSGSERIGQKNYDTKISVHICECAHPLNIKYTNFNANDHGKGK